MYVLGSRTSGGKRAGPSIYELNARGEGRSAREVPRLVAAGVAITWRAGRRELLIMAALELLSGIGVAAEVVVGRRVLEALLATQHASAGLANTGLANTGLANTGLANTGLANTGLANTGLAGIWPSAVLLGVITAVLGLAGVV